MLIWNYGSKNLKIWSKILWSDFLLNTIDILLEMFIYNVWDKKIKKTIIR